jgi:hypothetical protein
MDNVSELAKAVAEEVMGWHIVEMSCGCAHWFDASDKYMADADFWWPDSEIDAAWQVFKRMIDQGYECLCSRYMDGTYDIEFNGHNRKEIQGRFGSSVGPELSRAMCKAALQAVTQPIETNEEGN